MLRRAQVCHVDRTCCAAKFPSWTASYEWYPITMLIYLSEDSWNIGQQLEVSRRGTHTTSSREICSTEYFTKESSSSMNKGVSQCTLKNRLSVIIFGRYKWQNGEGSVYRSFLRAKIFPLAQRPTEGVLFWSETNCDNCRLSVSLSVANICCTDRSSKEEEGVPFRTQEHWTGCQDGKRKWENSDV